MRLLQKTHFRLYLDRGVALRGRMRGRRTVRYWRCDNGHTRFSHAGQTSRRGRLRPVRYARTADRDAYYEQFCLRKEKINRNNRENST